MTGGGASVDPLLDFQLRPLDARRTWKNVVNKQRFDALLQKHRDHTDQDDLGREVTDALRRTIERQIANDTTLNLIPLSISPCSPTLSRTPFNPPFSPCKNSKMEVTVWIRTSKPSQTNSIPTKSSLRTPRSRWK